MAKREPPRPTLDEVLRRMLNTPPDAYLKKRKPRERAKK
jgi:hypothetical protein